MINTDGSQPSVNYVSYDNNQKKNFGGQNYGQTYNSRGRFNNSYRGRGNRGGFRGRGRSQGSRVTCQVCQVAGHTADRCWHRYDQSYGGQGQQQGNVSNERDNNNNLSNGRNPTLNMAHLPNNSNTSNEEGWWFPDSGASAHVTNDMNNLHSASEYGGSNRLQMGNGQGEHISHIGNTVLHSPQSDKLFHLKDLLHVPGITKNLISVSKFALDNSVFFEFHHLFCVIKDQATQAILPKGMLKDGLYRFNLDHHGEVRNKEHYFQNKPCVFTSLVCGNLDISLWHKRLGHCSYDMVKRALRGCNISFNNKKIVSNVCAPCILAKSHKLPFNASTSQSLSAFDLVHTDLWGPAPLDSVNGYKYYVTYVDDHSKFTWIYLLKQKSEVSSTFRHLYNQVETQFHMKIKGVQSDGGTEYKPLTEFFKDKGIIHKISCPYTPQQNGCAERKHRHVVEMGLSLLAQSNMPLKFWDDAFTTAVFLINRVPAKSLQFESPFEKLFKQKPDYTCLKVFGCLCYPHMRPYNKHKLEYRSTAGVFLGYNAQYKGYKVLLPSGKVIITRHIVFDEENFPFLSKTAGQGSDVHHSQPIFASTEPTVASFPATYQSHTQSPLPSFDHAQKTPEEEENSLSISKSHGSVQSDESFATEPLRIEPPPLDQNDHSSCRMMHSSENNATGFRNTNQHPMVTRAKAGIYKPKVLSAEVVGEFEPKNVNDALEIPVWREAMQQEYNALLRNNTWTLTTLPKDAHLVGNKWVFKVKRNADGSIERHKARLVAQGYTQTAGFDFYETFSPVVKPTTIRIILTLALSYSWNIRQLDVTNAFLNGDLSEVIYMKQPKGFEKDGNLVCKLNKALYGLKQASRAWYMKVKSTLSSLGFKNSKADCSLFFFNQNGIQIFILIYVDDILVTGNNDRLIHKLVEKLQGHFSIKDLGQIHHFLGIEVTKSCEGFHLCQREYIKKLLWKAKMLNASKCSTPMITSSHLSRYVGNPVQDAAEYRSIVGALHYVTITRPEICFAVNKVSQFMSNPLEPHWKAVKRILRYLAGTDHYGLNFHKPAHMNITGFSDSDWASDIDDRRSISGHCVYIGGNLVSWSSKKQNCVSRSSTEAEYRSLAQVVSEVSWIRYLLDELSVSQTRVPHIWIDNQSAIYLSSNPILHARTKHIELDFHFIREKVAAGSIQVNYVPSFDQNADILTKALGLQFFTRQRKSLTVIPHPEFELREDESQHT
ncbi:hypothetical protein CASFOL_021129 [Castilleja foliolosa]|uniref:Integrase catalytic domain-containing protein n=1 Tax=Castilleja foliolosa TaxID=1961234 RepID=A0ABD3CZH0_9LAMI